MKEISIYEDKQEQQGGLVDWRDLMTDEQKERGQYYHNEYMLRSAEIATHKTLWDRLSDLYACQREAYDQDPDYPNNFVPLLTPTIEGQVAAIIESSMEFNHVTDMPGQEAIMKKYDAASEYSRRKNNFNLAFKDFARFYDLYGNAWVTMFWEDSLCKKKGKPSGYPRLYIPPLLSVIIDGRIKDFKDIQYAEYIIHEIGFQTIDFARREYGDEYAEALSAGGCRYEGTSPDVSTDDSKSWTLLHVWTRNNEKRNLQLIEMDTTGLILRESDPSKPYYKHVDNEYPFYFCRMIPVIGQFYGYGDGMILKPMQETVNNLTDELELAARFSAQSKLAIDPKANASAYQFNSNPSIPIVCTDPNNNIRVLQGGGINPIVVTMIEFLLREAQKATRFSDIMTGNKQGVSATATQINSQMQQGMVGIQDKRSDIAQAMQWADRYMLKLCLEYWDMPFWASIGYDYSEYIDPEYMLKTPAQIPLTSEKMEEYLAELAENPSMKIPQTQEVLDSNGKPIMVDIDFDTKVIMSQGIPRGKTDMYNILLGLAQMQVVDENGIPEPLITAKRIKQLMEQTLGFKLEAEGEDVAGAKAAMLNQQAMAQQNPIGAGDSVQVPTSNNANLLNNVPQVPGGDNRGLVI